MGGFFIPANCNLSYRPIERISVGHLKPFRRTASKAGANSSRRTRPIRSFAPKAGLRFSGGGLGSFDDTNNRTNPMAAAELEHTQNGYKYAQYGYLYAGSS